MGFNSPWRGFRYLQERPKLWGILAFPVLLTAIGISLSMYVGFFVIPPAVIVWIGSFGVSLSGWIFSLFSLAVGISSAVGLLLMSLGLVKLFLAPVNSLFVESVVRDLRKQISLQTTGPREGFLDVLSLTLRMFGVSLARSVVFFGIALVLFFLTWIPGLQIFTGFMGLLLATFDCWDYTLEAHRMNFRDRMTFFLRHLPEAAGFSLALGTMLIVPGLGILLFPLALTGAAILCSQLHSTSIRMTNHDS